MSLFDAALGKACNTFNTNKGGGGGFVSPDPCSVSQTKHAITSHSPGKTPFLHSLLHTYCNFTNFRGIKKISEASDC